MAKSTLRLTQCWPYAGEPEPKTAQTWLLITMIRSVAAVRVADREYSLVKLWPANTLYVDFESTLYVDYPAEKLAVLIDEYYDAT